MGFDPEAWLREEKRKREAWYRRAATDVDNLKRQAEDRGREIWQDGTRLGKAVQGETISVLRQLGAPKPPTGAGRPPIARSSTPPPATHQSPKASWKPPSWQDAKDIAGASLRGASDGATFGLGDNVIAYARSGAPWEKDHEQRYKANLEAEHAQDAYDRDHHKIARGVGEVSGAVGTMMLAGPIGAEIAIPRLAARFAPRAAKFLEGVQAVNREAPLARNLADHLAWSARVAGAGGALGAGSQVVSDTIRGKGLSSPTTYVATTVGGAADGLGTMYLGPARGGALGGAVTTATEDLLNGRFPSGERMATSALAGNLLGGAADTLGRFRSHTLPTNVYNLGGNSPLVLKAREAKAAAKAAGKEHLPWLQDKGNLGDRLSEMRSRIEGEGVEMRQKLYEVSKGKTRVDHVTKTGRPVEAKFGFSAKLSDPQKLAQKEIDGYRVDHFLPRDIGKILAGPLTTIATAFHDQRRYH